MPWQVDQSAQKRTVDKMKTNNSVINGSLSTMLPTLRGSRRPRAVNMQGHLGQNGSVNNRDHATVMNLKKPLDTLTLMDHHIL
jgi:hypothetical protein